MLRLHGHTLFGNILLKINFKKMHFQLFSTGSEVYYDIGFKDLMEERQLLQP